MGIKRDLSGLPAQTSAESVKPDPEADQYLLPLAQSWYDAYIEGGNDDRAFAVAGTRYRASWAGGCARSNGYRVLENDAKMRLAMLEDADSVLMVSEQAPELIAQARAVREHYKPTNPPSLADLWRMSLGSNVHSLFDDAIQAAFPNAEVEVAVDLRPDIDGSATVDVKITERVPVEYPRPVSDTAPELAFRERVTLLELKTLGGFGFKKAVIPFKGPAEGPKLAHILQVGMAAKAIGAERIIIGYLSMENISKGIADKAGLADHNRFLAGWVYEAEDFLPVVDKEERRINAILKAIDEGRLPPRHVNDGELPTAARITNVDNGLWTVTNDKDEITNSGTTWWCGYCWSRDRCREDGPDGVVPIELRLSR